MIKYICDICNKELTTLLGAGSVKYTFKTIGLSNDTKMGDMVKEVEILACPSCMGGIKSYIDGQKGINKTE